MTVTHLSFAAVAPTSRGLPVAQRSDVDSLALPQRRCLALFTGICYAGDPCRDGRAVMAT